MHDKILKLEKHPYNVMPAMTAEERKDVRLDIKTYGYDSNFPIILYQNMVLDGWHRQEICEELQVVPVYEEFLGSDLEAYDLVWRAAKRRNITSSQWAVAAMKAQPLMDEILAKMKAEKAEKLKGNHNARKEKQMVESIPPSDLPKKERDDSRRAKVQFAKRCHTNTKYIEKAKTLTPDVLEKVEKGEVSLSEIIRAEKTEALESQMKRMEAKKIREDALKESADTAVKEDESVAGEPTKRLMELTVEISEELLIRLKAFAIAQNIEMKIHGWDLDYKQAAVDLISIGVSNPPFKYDSDAMKAFSDEIQRLCNHADSQKSMEV
jgi:hypothetical protein